MVCAGCGVELPSSFGFCARCGRRQPTTCPSCGFCCEAEFVFCPRCGAARGADRSGAEPNSAPSAAVVLSSAPAISSLPTLLPEALRRETDRRQVTILFADLSGFTALAERIDPEEVRAFQSALFDTLAQATLGHGGFVDKFMGDAVLAVFGAPIAHEDDPERALQTALDMLARATALSADWEARLGQPVTLHIAVHTGPVVAGSLGHAAGAAYEVTGDTVNTASRLLGAAAPGTILVSDATHALARHRFAFQADGEVTLRGKARPIGVHRLLGRLTAPQSARAFPAWRMPA